MTHFKRHEQAGFDGTLKNLGMGSASRQGKLELHSSSQPIIDEAICTSCGQCVKKACVDLVTQAGANTNTVLNAHEQGELQNTDKFAVIHLNTNWKAGLQHGEEIGLGTMAYELIKV